MGGGFDETFEYKFFTRIRSTQGQHAGVRRFKFHRIGKITNSLKL